MEICPKSLLKEKVKKIQPQLFDEKDQGSKPLLPPVSNPPIIQLEDSSSSSPPRYSVPLPPSSVNSLLRPAQESFYEMDESKILEV